MCYIYLLMHMCICTHIDIFYRKLIYFSITVLLTESMILKYTNNFYMDINLNEIKLYNVAYINMWNTIWIIFA